MESSGIQWNPVESMWIMWGMVKYWAGRILPSHKLALGSHGRCKSGERPVRSYGFWKLHLIMNRKVKLCVLPTSRPPGKHSSVSSVALDDINFLQSDNVSGCQAQKPSTLSRIPRHTRNSRLLLSVEPIAYAKEAGFHFP